MSPDSSVSLSFPDGPKLELDQLIDQLMDRAQGVKQAQGRLRELLRAIELVTGDPGLEAVLHHAVEAACALSDARYGALGVISHDGGLERFIHVGLDRAAVERIGPLPQGKGLLGALISDPRPIRLAHIADDPRSAGFPDAHPPMESFLGVPIRVRGEVFGNLYLTDSRSGQFSVEDQELVRSLAVTAGTAISQARLYQESRLQQRWLGASVEISAQLLSASGEDPLKMIARRAIEIAEADVVTVGLLTADGADVMVDVAVGTGAEELLGQRFPVVETLTGKAIEDRTPLLIRSDLEGGARPSHLAVVIDAGPVMVIPLVATGKVLGALSIARVTGRPVFTAADLSMATGFANHASVALELAAARADQQRVVLLEDRDRIARDLHDHVIQQLFAIGLSVESVATLIAPNEAAAQKLHARVADIDRTIRQIRTSIFELRGPLATGPDGLRQSLLEIAGDLTPALGFAPRVAFSGAVDVALTGQIGDDLAACTREALANVAKHARATSVDVDVTVAGGEVVISISDNGVGISGNTPLSGLANLRARAQNRGGTFDLVTSPSGGVQLIWKAPITS
jgi:signal transduction histidine kinase